MGIVNGEEASRGEKDPPSEPQANGDHGDSRETPPDDVTDNGMLMLFFVCTCILQGAHWFTIQLVFTHGSRSTGYNFFKLIFPSYFSGSDKRT